MTPEKETLLIIRGTITGLSQADQKQVKAAETELRTVVSKYPGGHAQMALALLSAELAQD